MANEIAALYERADSIGRTSHQMANEIAALYEREMPCLSNSKKSYFNLHIAFDGNMAGRLPTWLH